MSEMSLAFSNGRQGRYVVKKTNSSYTHIIPPVEFPQILECGRFQPLLAK